MPILGQAAPGATTWTKLYTVPADTIAELDVLYVANRSGATENFRLSWDKGGAGADGDTNSDYTAYQVDVATKDFCRLPLDGVSLQANDVVWVYSSGANLSYNLFGYEGIL